MQRRLVYLVVGGTLVAAAATVILRYFSDILPLASTEPQSIWRFETASLLTSLQWIALAVVAFAVIAIIMLLLKSAGARQR